MRSEKQKRMIRKRCKNTLKFRNKVGAALSGDPKGYLRTLNQDRQCSENQMRGPGR